MMGETETMLKIFLAEDEIVMREGIRNNIAWQEEGFEFVGEASDGELALSDDSEIKTGHPDHGHQDAFYGWTGT